MEPESERSNSPQDDHNLYTQVMQPILDELPDSVEKIIISPDSKLSFLLFSALYRRDSILTFTGHTMSYHSPFCRSDYFRVD